MDHGNLGSSGREDLHQAGPLVLEALLMPDERETLQPQAKTVELQKCGVATFPLSAFALSTGEVLSQRPAC